MNITFFINCKGEDFNYRLCKFSDGLTKLDTISDFQRKFLSDLQTLLSWTPGHFKYYDKGKPIIKQVDFQGSYTIRIDEKGLQILMKKRKKAL